MQLIPEPRRAYNQVMARLAGILLVLAASASMALGAPVCCLLESGCCGSTHAEEAQPEEGRCPHCPAEKPDQPQKPAPKPCDGDHACVCKSHTAAAVDDAHAHAAPLATLDVPEVVPAAPQAAPAPVAVPRAAPPACVQRTLPLLL